MNYFSNLYQELLFNWAKNYFSRYREFIFWSKMHCGPSIWSGLVRVFDFVGRPFRKLCRWRSTFKENAKAKHCQGKKRKRFSSCLQNLSRASSPSLVMRLTGPKILIIEETTKGLHDSYTILTLIEHDMSARLNCSLPSLVPRVFVSYYTCWLSGQRRREWGVSPTLKFRKKLPILIQTGEH